MVAQVSAIHCSKVHAKTRITLQFALGEYAASRQHGDSRAFQVGEMAFHSKVQRGATFVDTISANLVQSAFEPLSGKGLCQVPQNVDKIRNVAPL